jgi:formate/nitrite transporter FocA (FNT family)
VDAAYLVATGEAGFPDDALRFFLRTLCGNGIGGVLLVAVLNDGHVAREVAARA